MIAISTCPFKNVKSKNQDNHKSNYQINNINRFGSTLKLELPKYNRKLGVPESLST